MSEKTPPLEDLTKLMLLFGKVSEVHLKNLRLFPFIFFRGHMSDPKLDYSIATTDKTEPTLFCYDFTLNLVDNDNLPQRYSALENAIRNLFWKEAKVKVNINGEEVYKSE